MPLFASSTGTAKSILSGMKATVTGYKADADAIRETADEDNERLNKLAEAAKKAM